MLILSRRKRERIKIGDKITVEVVSLGRGKVRLGVVAPEGVPVHREEVAKRIEELLMQNKVLLKIYEIVGSPVWVSTEDGQKVYEKIVAAFKAGRAVELSFANRKNLITAFLNAAIGQLYNGNYSEQFLRDNLTFVDISPEDRQRLELTISNAKRYFANRPQYDAAWQQEVGDEEGGR